VVDDNAVKQSVQTGREAGILFIHVHEIGRPAAIVKNVTLLPETLSSPGLRVLLP
jgi:hypothetical protein